MYEAPRRVNRPNLAHNHAALELFSIFQIIRRTLKIDEHVKSQNLAQSRKARKVNLLILCAIFLAFLAPSREKTVFTVLSKFISILLFDRVAGLLNFLFNYRQSRFPPATRIRSSQHRMELLPSQKNICHKGPKSQRI